MENQFAAPIDIWRIQDDLWLGNYDGCVIRNITPALAAAVTDLLNGKNPRDIMAQYQITATTMTLLQSALERHNWVTNNQPPKIFLCGSPNLVTSMVTALGNQAECSVAEDIVTFPAKLGTLVHNFDHNDLVIWCVDSLAPDPAVQHRYGSTLPYLVVRSDQTESSVGPLVIPKVTACLNCVERQGTDSFRARNYFKFVSQRTASGPASGLAVQLASQAALDYCRNGTSQFINCSWHILNHRISIRNWQKIPGCCDASNKEKDKNSSNQGC